MWSDNPRMDPHRFYVPDLSHHLAEIPLPEDQAHHLCKVLRLQEGQGVVLFDGQGVWGPATLINITKSQVTARLSEPLTVDPPPAPRLTLATAVPKGDRADWLVEQASQLNVSIIQWLDCQRSVVRPGEGGQKIAKWRRLAIESAKQCGRTHLLRIEPPVPPANILKRPPAILWLDPREGGGSVAQARAALGTQSSVTALIGPEGGWSDHELNLLQAAASRRQVHRIRLTATVLRIETACAAVAAMVMNV
jgi:16S rRNA (uracil1498-N3)-methyltransferase